MSGNNIEPDLESQIRKFAAALNSFSRASSTKEYIAHQFILPSQLLYPNIVSTLLQLGLIRRTKTLFSLPPGWILLTKSITTTMILDQSKQIRVRLIYTDIMIGPNETMIHIYFS